MVKYMVAVDGSESSGKAFDVVLRLIKQDQDVVVLVTVPKTQKETENSDKILQKYRDICSEKSINFETISDHHGDPRTVLCQLAENNHVDTLVVGTRGLGPLKRLILGSVSSYVVEHATCDVIVAK